MQKRNSRPPAVTHPPKKAPRTEVGPQRWFIVVPPGLEFVAQAELKQHQIEGKIEPGGVSFTASLLTGALLVERLRVPTRLLVELGSGKVFTYDELAVLVRRLPWAPFISPLSEIEVHASLSESRLRFRDVAEKKVRWAIGEALKGPRVMERERRPTMPQRVQLRLNEDKATLSVDAGGDLLHFRGWRQSVGEAPIRENLAAALLQLAGWDGQEPLVDPFCGSGTILIEASLWAARRSSFTRADFACREWPALAGKRWSGQEVMPNPTAPILMGSDRDPKVLVAARENAERAGVSNIRWLRHPASELTAPAATGLIVTNPPYGHRLEEETGYLQFGELLRSRYGGWRALFLAPTPQLAHKVSRDAFCLTTFSNGGLRVGAWAVNG